MARFALLVLCGSALWICACSGEAEKSADIESSVSESQESSEITNYDDPIEESTERRRREAPKTENSNSQFIRSEKTTTADNIIWGDNSETRKQGHVPSVIKVLYHGIYPSLNVTVPLNSTYAGRYMQKRAVPENTRGKASDIISTATSSSTVIAIDSQDSRPTERREQGKTRSTNDSMLEKTQQYTPESRTPYPIPTYRPRMPVPPGNHYQRAVHSQIELNNPYLSQVDPYAPQDYAQGSIRYRTKYLPASTTYQVDPENKGRVKLISVGYYSINESTDGLRSYRNPKVDRTRAKRDTHWAWLDKFFKSICIVKNAESDRENEIPGSEPLKLEVSVVNEEAQDVYGYSSNGHSHPHNVDRIYLVQNDPKNPNKPENSDYGQVPKLSSVSPPQGIDVGQTLKPGIKEHDEDEMLLPADKPVLIQAPPRRIVCRPPKRLARGRCRTVW